MRLYILTATASEARPLIAYFSLKHQVGHPFPTFISEEVCLMVSGIGKINAAACTASLLTTFPIENTPILLNIGIAGHEKEEIGTIALAHKITDASSENVYYPGTPILGKKSLSLLTVEKPGVYPQNAMVDMEGAGFYPVALKFTTSELAHSLKVISDNQDFQTLTKKFAEELVAEALPTVKEITESLLELVPTTRPISFPKCTATEKEQIRELVTKLRAFGVEPILEGPNLIKRLREELKQHAL